MTPLLVTFDSGELAPFEAEQGEVAVVLQGSSFSSSSDTRSLEFPSPSHALLLRDATAAMPLRVAREQLALSLYSEGELTVILELSGTWFVPDIGLGAFVQSQVPLASWCGQELELSLTSSHPELSLFTLVDDVGQVGAPCPGQGDEDGDGWCALGPDLDGDGLCSEQGELAGPGDCDDEDARVSPGQEEIAADALDNDCSGGDPPGSATVAGAVLEDRDGDGELSDALPVEQALVEVWVDGGDGQPDGSDDRWLTLASTAADGSFLLQGLNESLPLWVSAVSPRSGAAWAEQTWGPAGSWCADGAGGTRELALEGPCFAGKLAQGSDGQALGEREHLVRLVAGSELTFAFSYEVLTSTRDGDDVQGGLRQLLDNASSLPGPHQVHFVPADPPVGGVFSITAASPWPVVPADTLLDGTAWCDGVSCPWGTVRDSNPGETGEIAVGLEDLLDPWQLPELELVGQPLVLAGEGASLRALSLREAGVEVVASGAHLSDLWITSAGVQIDALADEVTLDHLWIQTDGDGVVREGPGDHLLVTHSRIEATSRGIVLRALGGTSRGDRIRQTHVTGGVLLDGGGGSLRDLRLLRSSVTGGEQAGVEVTDGASEILLERCELAENGGPGLAVHDSASGVQLSRSLVRANVGPPVDLGLDGVTPLDTPLLSFVALEAPDELRVQGSLAQPVGGRVELYVAEDDGDQDGHGELGRYLGACDTDLAGALDCVLVLDEPLALSELVTAAATVSGSTSEPAANAPTVDGSPDLDGDGLSLLEELERLTDPSSSDTDSDGLSDGAELEVHLTDPLLADTDGGSVSDGLEVKADTDPLDSSDDLSAIDSDGDGLDDASEGALGTDPQQADTDGGGLPDGAEIDQGRDPLDPSDDQPPADQDHDGLADELEPGLGTDPDDPDTDGDRLLDGVEAPLSLDPTDYDTDGDSLSDGDELLVWRTDPRDPDTDGGGVADGLEISRGTDPRDPDDDVRPPRDEPPEVPVLVGGGGWECDHSGSLRVPWAAMAILSVLLARSAAARAP